MSKVVELDEEVLLDAIETAERTQLITSSTHGTETRFIFFHELIRQQTLINDLSLPRRQRLHLRVSEAMEKLYSETLEEHSAELAHHLTHAGATAELMKTVRYLTMAGKQALDSLAFEEALRYCDNVLSLQPTEITDERAELLYNRGLALRSLTQWDDALVDWRNSLGLYEKLGNTEAVGRVCVEISYLLTDRARFDEAYEAASRGLAALGDSRSAARSNLLATSAYILSFIPGGDFEFINALFTQAIDIAEENRRQESFRDYSVAKGDVSCAIWAGDRSPRNRLASGRNPAVDRQSFRRR